MTFWDSFQSFKSHVDNYLTSLLGLSAFEAIAGLPLTANYQEVIATLQKRFGNPQLIVTRHMENISAVSSQHDVKAPRKFTMQLKLILEIHNTVEANIRGLRALESWLAIGSMHLCQALFIIATLPTTATFCPTFLDLATSSGISSTYYNNLTLAVM